MKPKTPKLSQEPRKQSRWGFRGMTVRDWLPIVGTLLIPFVIALGTWWLTWQQAKNEEQRAQDAALQAYLDHMSTLMLDKNLLNEEGTLPHERWRGRGR